VAGRRAGLKDGILYNNSIIRISEITDGTSSTLIVGERPPDAGFDFGWWYAGFGIDGFGTFDSVMGVAEYDPSSIFGIGPTCGIPTVQFTAANGFEDPCGRYHFWSPHSGGANFAMADGAVRFVRYFNDPIMAALATRRGGEAVTLVE
jgi:prepilin-type processing-associated H-X9-DG protein